MNENVKGVLKGIANLAINSGASHFFSNVAVATMPAGVGGITKFVTIAAASLMGSMMGDKTFDYTVKMVEDTKKAVNEMMSIDISSEDFEEEKK